MENFVNLIYTHKSYIQLYDIFMENNQFNIYEQKIIFILSFCNFNLNINNLKTVNDIIIYNDDYMSLLNINNYNKLCFIDDEIYNNLLNVDFYIKIAPILNQNAYNQNLYIIENVYKKIIQNDNNINKLITKEELIHYLNYIKKL